MPIISVKEGQQIGSVRGLIINPTNLEVAALLVDQKGLFKEQRVIPYSKVISVGDQAITIDKIASAEKVVNLPETISLVKDRIPIINAKVITENGKALGIVEEFDIDTTTGKIIGIEIASNFVSGLFKGRGFLASCHLVTMGKDVIIAVGGAEDSLTPVETGISETLKNVMDSTSTLWSSSLQKTKDISKHLARGKDRIELTPTNIETHENSEPKQPEDLS